MFLFALALFSWEWVETTQQDFKDGFYEANLYPSHRGDGAVEFSVRWDANNDGWIDVTNGSTIFWGSETGFSDSRSTSYSGGYGCAYADLNIDGYVDLVNTSGVNIFWGNADGPNPSNYTNLSLGEEACFVADFNKDGYLDIAFDYADYNDAGIYWGTSGGYSESYVTLLPAVQSQHNIEAADLNKDGWLDLIFVNQHASYNTIYWGSPTGFHAEDANHIPYLSSYIHGLSVADLDDDGWLDLVFTGNYGIDESWIYWGPSFSTSDRTELSPGESYGGSSVCDFDKDGKLDIVYFRGAKTSYRTPIYWGDGQRFQTKSSTTIGPTMRSSCGLVADFDQDGNPDIFLNGFDGSSPILYGPSFSEAYRLSAGSHHALAREIGNVYNRKYTEEYYSSIYDAGNAVLWGKIHWEDSCPGNSSLKMAVRTGQNPDTSSGWSNWIVVQNDTEIPGNIFSRYIQYQATFEYPNPAYLPVLFLVGIEYFGIEEIIVRPDREGAGFPGDTVPYTLNVINFTHLPDVVEISTVIDNPDWYHEVSDSVGNPLGDFDNDLSPDVGELDAYGDSTSLKVKVGIPYNPSVPVDTMIVYGHSSNPLGLYDSALVITRVLPPVRIIVDPDQDTVAWPGQTIDFALWGINYGKDPDVIDLVATSERGWQVELLDSAATTQITDSDGDFIPDLGAVDARGGREHFTARVRIPPAAAPFVSDTVRVIGISSQDTLVTDLAVLVIQVLPEVWIEVEPDQDTIAAPGQRVNFLLWEANHGRWDDIIDLTIASVRGWHVELLDSAAATSLRDYDTDGIPDVGIVPLDGEKRYFTARVSVPMDALVGEPDTVYILGTSSNDTTVKDLAMLVINPAEISLLEIRPDQAGSVSPDAPTVRYALEVLNHGNISDVGEITTRSSFGWNVVLLDATARRRLDDTDGDGVPDVGELAPYTGAYNLYAEVSLPEVFDPTRGVLDTLSGAFSVSETTVVYVGSAREGVVHDSAVLITTASPGLAVHNYPNPFEGETRIVWSQPEDGVVTLRVADRAGRPVGEIMTDYCEAGVHSFLWEARTDRGYFLAPGVYILLMDFRPDVGPPQRMLVKMLCTQGGSHDAN